jgi:uncharacterized protein YqgC (DUF456 family)
MLGLLLAVIGMAACLFPILPGPFISYVSLLVLLFVKNGEPFSTTFLIVFAVLALAVTASDTVFSLMGAKRYGASKMGIFGSILGMLVGFFFFPPFGIFFGAVLGALAGELLTGKTSREALRAGWGVLLGNVMSMALKLAYCAVVVFFYVKAMI